jgi:tetratricopeptide (TPR) repeat protein
MGLALEKKLPSYNTVFCWEPGCPLSGDAQWRLQASQRECLSFGNWYRSGAGTKSDRSICHVCHLQLSRIERLGWKKISSAKDLGDTADNLLEVEYELVGNVVAGKEADATSLLLAAQSLICQLEEEDFMAKSTPICARALSMRQALYGEWDLRTAEAMVELAKSDCDDDEMYELLTKSLTIRQALLPPKHKLIGQTLHSLGRYFLHQEEDAKAAHPCFQRTVEIVELSNDRHLMAEICSSMGDCLEELERGRESLFYYQRALTIGETKLGESHLDTATYRCNLASFYRGMGSNKLGEFYSPQVLLAVPLYRQTLKTYEVVLGTDSAACNEVSKHMAALLSQALDANQEQYSREMDRYGRLLTFEELGQLLVHVGSEPKNSDALGSTWEDGGSSGGYPR